MAYVILGLLLLRSMSRYDLVKAFESGVSLFYSASSGSIKRALDGLVQRGLVEVESTEEGGRGRKTYAVTEAGRATFLDWMRSDITGDLETGALARLYFLGLLDAADRAPVLERAQARIEQDLRVLEDLQERVSAAEVPDGFEDVAHFQRATLDYGLMSHRASRDWFGEQVRRIGHADD